MLVTVHNNRGTERAEKKQLLERDIGGNRRRYDDGGGSRTRYGSHRCKVAVDSAAAEARVDEFLLETAKIMASKYEIPEQHSCNKAGIECPKSNGRHRDAERREEKHCGAVAASRQWYLMAGGVARVADSDEAWARWELISQHVTLRLRRAVAGGASLDPAFAQLQSTAQTANSKPGINHL